MIQRLVMTDDFADANQKSERNNKLLSLGITILIHAAIILMFIYLFGMIKPFPPLSEGSGVELNIGNTDQGLGDEQVQGVPISTATDISTPSAPHITNPAPHIITQTIDNTAPVLNNSPTHTASTDITNQNNNSTQTSNTNNTTTTQTTHQDPKPKYQFGSTNHGGSSQGNTKPGGDQGSPNGSPFGTSYSGNPGNGGNPSGTNGTSGAPSLSLGSRSIKTFPTITDKTQKTGIVNVMIKVDRSGKVIFAQATQKESTTTDSYLWDLAEKAALQTSVTPDANAPEEQFGYLKFTFKVK